MQDKTQYIKPESVYGKSPIESVFKDLGIIAMHYQIIENYLDSLTNSESYILSHDETKINQIPKSQLSHDIITAIENEIISPGVKSIWKDAIKKYL